MKLRMALIAAILCTAAPAWSQTQPGTTATPPPQHAPGQSGTKAPEAAPADKPAEKLDPAKEAAIRHLMEVTEISKMGDSLNEAVIARVRDGMSKSGALPQDQLPKFMETFTQRYKAAAAPSAVTNAIIPIYAKNFSMEEIQGLIKFYESPLGQRSVKVLPSVVAQSQEAGVEVDRPIMFSTLRGMEGDYPQLKPMLEPPSQEPASGGTPADQPPAKLAPSTTPANPPPPTITSPK